MSNDIHPMSLSFPNEEEEKYGDSNKPFSSSSILSLGPKPGSIFSLDNGLFSQQPNLSSKTTSEVNGKDEKKEQPIIGQYQNGLDSFPGVATLLPQHPYNNRERRGPDGSKVPLWKGANPLPLWARDLANKLRKERREVENPTPVEYEIDDHGGTNDVRQAVLSGMQAGRLLPEVIRKQSLFSLTHAPPGNGWGRNLDSPLLGATVDRACGTCAGRCASAGKIKACAGHRSHIELSTPNLMPPDMPFIQSELQVACRNCSSLLIHTGTKDSTLDAVAIRMTADTPVPLSKQDRQSLDTIWRRPFTSLNMYSSFIYSPLHLGLFNFFLIFYFDLGTTWEILLLILDQQMKRERK